MVDTTLFSGWITLQSEVPSSCNGEKLSIWRENNCQGAEGPSLSFFPPQNGDLISAAFTLPCEAPGTSVSELGSGSWNWVRREWQVLQAAYCNVTLGLGQSAPGLLPIPRLSSCSHRVFRNVCSPCLKEICKSVYCAIKLCAKKYTKWKYAD
jgi:hypothetical protein